MKRLPFYITSLFLLVALFSNIAANAKKKKKKRKKAKQELVQPAVVNKDSIKVVRAPGVPNQQQYDSLKSAKNKQKLDSLSKLELKTKKK